MKNVRSITALVALVSMLLFASGCTSRESRSDAIPRFSTPATRLAIMLRELERQTKLLQELRDELKAPRD